ncbi:MAG TPA: hydroxyisourate hydrolase [Polyangiaceae bacterium]|nr:hydroxyisourate hydrolase [Polyangiaceae bacterium]
MSPITSHVLDTALGRPAENLRVRLELCGDAGSWQTLAERATDRQGRVSDFLPEGSLEAGTYRLVFDTQSYFDAAQRETFYPGIEIVFRVTVPGEHYHVPLLLSPFGYSTYRGS